MWKIKQISAENFMSFEKVEFLFDSKCYVVQGLNLDNDGQKSNGGGKTSFADIAAIALLGYSLTGRNVKNCVNWYTDAKSFVVQLHMVNEAHGLVCDITRRIYSGSKGQELSLLVNSAVPTTLPTKKGVENGVDVREGNAYILKEILDITEDDLLNYYFISKKNYAPFLEINTDRKLEVIGRFSRADVVETVISRLTDNVKEIDRDIANKNHEISRAEGHIEALNKMLLEPAIEEFERQKQADIAAAEKEMESHLARLDSIAEELGVEEARLAELSSIEILDWDEKMRLAMDKCTAMVAKVSEQNNYIKLKNEQLHKFEVQLQSAISCPKCNHKFSLKGTTIPSTVEIDAIKDHLSRLHEEKSKFEAEAQAAQNELAPMLEEKKAQDALLIEINSINRKIKSLNDEFNRVESKIIQCNDRIEALRQATFEDAATVIQQQLSEKEQELQGLRLQLQELNEENANVKRWVEHFYDFKFYLGNKPIENICALVNEYLRMNGSDLNLFIEGFKKLRSGELRQALNPVVYRNWTNPQPLEQFSEGERVRLNLTVDLAFQQLINSTSAFGGLDYYQNDELLNPLDSLGVSLAAQAFNQLNKTIVLVTHSGADMVYENTILITKENKVSRI